MEISALNRAVRAPDLPLNKLLESKHVSEQEKISEASRQFEAVLLRQILSQAQKPLFKSSLFGNDTTTKAIYQDMITEQLADRISRGGSFGISKVVEQQLSRPEAAPSQEISSESKTSKPEPGKRI